MAEKKRSFIRLGDTYISIDQITGFRCIDTEDDEGNKCWIISVYSSYHPKENKIHNLYLYDGKSVTKVLNYLKSLYEISTEVFELVEKDNEVFYKSSPLPENNTFKSRINSR